jgi:hypothetical protein
MLLLGEGEVNGPAAANVRPWFAEVIEDRRVGAAGLFQGVGQDGEPRGVEEAAGQEALAVRSLSEQEHGRSLPGRIGCDGAEGVADKVP